MAPPLSTNYVTSLISRNMAHNPSVRESRFNWWIRILSTIFTISILAIAAASASSFSSISCSIPSRLSYQIACAVIALPYLIYILVTTGPMSRRSNFWAFWPQLGCDIFFFILWIAAAAVTTPDCNDICAACFSGGTSADVYGLDANALVTIGSEDEYCVCNDPNASDDSSSIPYIKRAVGNLIRRGLGSIGRSVFSGMRKRASTASRVGRETSLVQSRQGLDGVMIFLFILVIIVTLVLKHRERISNNASHEPQAEGTHMQEQEPKGQPSIVHEQELGQQTAVHEQQVAQPGVVHQQSPVHQTTTHQQHVGHQGNVYQQETDWAGKIASEI